MKNIKMDNGITRKAGISIPDGFKVIGMKRGGVEVERPDGLHVFLSRHDPIRLNRIRLRGRKEEVIYAVGMFRGMQIAQNYAQRYAPEINVDTSCRIDDLSMLLSGGIL